MGYEFIEDSRIGVVVYDVSIKDLETRRKMSITYNTLKLAEQRLGIGYNVIKNVAKKRLRVYSPILKKEIAIRYLK